MPERKPNEIQLVYFMKISYSYSYIAVKCVKLFFTFLHEVVVTLNVRLAEIGGKIDETFLVETASQSVC